MMAGPRTPRYSNNDDKNLIAEQPGRFILFSGVLLAVVLGLVLRGLIAPNKVKSLVEAAASRMHKDVEVQFEGAQISLARGLLPRFAVIITKVKMESANECWMKPELTADEIRLPLSLWSLVQGENPVTQVEAGKVQIALRSLYKNCETNGEVKAVETPQIKRFVTIKGGSSAREASPSNPQVKAILIDQLSISAPNLAEPLDLSAFAIRLKSHSPRVVEMTAKTHLMRDEQVGDYLSHATVWGEYSEFPRATLQARLSGNWREGSYQVKANYGMKEEELATELDLKHIPLSQVFQVLRKFQWLKEDLNGRQVWVSLNAQSTITKSNFKGAQMQLKDLRLEGDLGDLKVDEVRVVSLSPVKYYPFTVDVRRLNGDKLFALMNKPHPAPILGQLGSFDGTAVVTDQDHIKLTGVHRGLEFIFSNKGQREMQVLREIAADLSLEKDKWNVKVSRFLLDQGVFDGQLQVAANREFKNLEVKAKANEIRLSPNVVRLMTAGGTIGTLSGDLNLKFQDGKMNFAKGVLNSENADVEGVAFEKARFNLDYHGADFQSQAQIQKMAIKVGSPAFQILKDLIEPDWMSESSLQMRNLSTHFHAESFKALGWKNFSAQLEKGGRLSSEGEWNTNGALSGQVQVHGSKTPHKWILGGKRDNPEFIPVDLTKKKK